MNKENEYVVTKIVKKNKKYIVNFTNNIEYQLSEDQIVEFRVIIGKVFDEEKIKELNSSINLSNLYNKTIHYIDYKPRTRKEIIAYLTKEKASQQVIDELINKLIRINYINDERYCKNYINEAIIKLKGKNYIKKNLLDKGINIEYIDNSLKEYVRDIEFENAYLNAIKVIKKIENFPIKKQKQKLTEKLFIDGFDYTIIHSVINKIEFIDNSDEQLEKEYNRLLLKGIDKNKIVQKLLSKGYDYVNIKKLL